MEFPQESERSAQVEFLAMLEAAREGDDDAFAELVVHWHGYLLLIAS